MRCHGRKAQGDGSELPYDDVNSRLVKLASWIVIIPSIFMLDFICQTYRSTEQPLFTTREEAMGKLKSNINWNAPIMRRYAGNIRLGIVEAYLSNMRAAKIKRETLHKDAFVTNQIGRA